MKDHGNTFVSRRSFLSGLLATAVLPAWAQSLALAHQVAGRGSLIEPNRRYVDQLRVYERPTANAGLSKLHGLRHLYAQERYRELTESLARQRLASVGWAAPVCGGPKLKELTGYQKAIDHDVRLTISRELGHERERITTIYLGV